MCLIFSQYYKTYTSLLISVSQVIWGAKAPQRFFIFHSITVKRNQFFSSPMCSRQISDKLAQGILYIRPICGGAIIKNPPGC